MRFQQTCGPIMAKGVEDTAFYRWYPLVSLCEVGGDPTGSDIGAGAFHRWAAHQQAEWPTGMTTLSTHDTKRSEDVRLPAGGAHRAVRRRLEGLRRVPRCRLAAMPPTGACRRRR